MMETFSVEVGGRTMTFETGKLAKQANGAVRVTQGETSLLVTACISDKPREGLDFLPLLVDYEERFYSAGKIPGGFIKREGRPSETAILASRIIDRSIRSLFHDHTRNDIHVVATTLSVDQSTPPNILAINGASAALMLSGIPWKGPVGAVRVGRIDGRLVINPTEDLMKESTLDLVVSGHSGGITMVEAGAGEIPEDVLPPPAEPVTPAVPGDGVDPRPAVTRDQLIASLQRVYQPAFAACFADQLIARLSTDELKDVYYGPLSGELPQDVWIEVMISVDACD